MKKVFKLASAEFNKIFLRPSIFILTAFLIISLVVSNVLYKPSTTPSSSFYENAETVGEMFTLFNGTTDNPLTKSNIEKDLDSVNIKIYNEYEDLTKSDELKTFQDKLSELDKDLTTGLREEKIYISSPSFNKSQVVNDLTKIKTKLSDFLSYLPTLKTKTINFYITYSQYDTIYENVRNVYSAFPQTFNEKTEKQYFLDFCDSILEHYSLKSSITILSKVQNEKIEISQTDYDKLKDDYFTKTKNKLSETYYTEIENFYNSNKSSSEKTDLAEMQKLILNFNSYEKMNSTLLNNKFMLLKVGEKTDTEIKDIIGYSEISKYQVNEQIQIYDYLIQNNKFDYNYLKSFNFNTNSGETTNAYDYTIYTMQILNILIIIFTIFYACSSIAGDQTSGTMKMIAIRPYTRTKLFAGKFLSCVMFGTMLSVIAFFASFIVGIISFGLPMMNCLVVFDARIIVTINPILLLLIYLLSCIVNLLFYITLAMFVCLIFKSNTLSVFLTSILYGAQLVLCGAVNQVWLKYTPFAHFDIFKYFGNSSFGFLKMNILPDTNFAVSGLILGLMIVVMNIISNFIFQKRDIT